jgi:hypothetical protein
MIGPRKLPGRKAPLAQRLRIDDLHAHLAPIDHYGPTGVGSAIADGLHALASVWKAMLRAVHFCGEGQGPDCEAA